MRFYSMIRTGLLYLCMLSAFPLTTQSQVEFFKGSWTEALAQAESEQKLIFVDAYTTWCGPCKAMDRNTFPHPKIGETMNQHFINVKLDMEKGEGLSFAREYRVRAYPTLLFINFKGKLIHKEEGYRPPNQFLQVIEKMVDPANDFSMLELAYQSGSEDPKILSAYALALYEAKKDYREAAKRYFATQTLPDLLEPENWKLIQTLLQDTESREFQYLLEKKKKFEKAYGDEVDAKILDMCKQKVLSAAFKRERSEYETALGIALNHLKDEGKGSHRLRMTYAEATNEWDDYAYKARVYFKKFDITDPAELNQAAWNFYQHISETKLLSHAENWARQATALANIADYNKTYALLLHKLNKKDEARRTANKAVFLARQEKLEMEPYHKLLRMIRAQ